MAHTKRDRGDHIFGDEARRDVLEANFTAEVLWGPWGATGRIRYNPQMSRRADDRGSDADNIGECNALPCRRANSAC